MTMGSEALKEINELKATITIWEESFTDLVYKSGSTHDMLEVFNSTPKQCLNQHDIALLNKLRDKFINSNHSCEHELLDMINSMELEK